MPAIGDLTRVEHDRVALLSFLGQTQLAGLPPMKFFRCPAAALLDSLQSNIVGRLDKNHRIALPSPTRFEQHGRIQQYRLAPGLLSAGDLTDDASLDLRMNDLFQLMPRGSMLFAVSEHPSCEDSTLHFAN